MRHSVTALLWITPLALHSTDAWAWGLYTHLYFAQLLLWAIPLADPRFRRAVKRFPELLLADIVAHNHFVPAHETLWPNPAPFAVHAASEWAMDAHLASQLYAHPHRLLRRHMPVITRFVSRHFGSSPEDVRRALIYLVCGEQLLRGSGLHHVAYRSAQVADAGVTQRFDDYVVQTALRLEQMNRVIAGDAPAWAPEVACALTARHKIHAGTLEQTPRFTPLPLDFFN